MKNTELNTNMVDEIATAIDNGDSKKLAELQMNQYQAIEDKVMKMYDELKEETDRKVLAQRGIRTLTKDEEAFYNKLIKFTNVGMSPTEGGPLVIPQTIVSRVFDDLQAEDSILGMIDLVNTTGATEWLVSVAEKPVAAWGELCDSVTKELSFGFKVVDSLTKKLSCYIPYCKSLLDLGPEWQDLYVREYLRQGLRGALATAIVSGNGTKQPWGMAYDYDIDEKTGTIKEAVTIKDFTRASLAPVFKTLTQNPMGYQRSLEGLTMFVDPDTYYSYVYPNDATLNAAGVYVSLLEQQGIKVAVMDTGLDKGKAIIGLPKRYFAQVGFRSQNGLITFSDDVLFLEDKRVYKAKLYADGFPKDKNAFVLLDLSTVAAPGAVAAAYMASPLKVAAVKK